MPGRTIGAKEVAEARGFADAAALRLRHHNERLHAAGAPADEVARAVFDAAEQARVEALGARSMAGVRANLRRARRDAAEDRSAGPGAQPRGGAAGLGGRADGARAADRRGAAGGRARRAGSGLATGSRRKRAPISTRSASRSTTRRRSPRWRPRCSATSSWSRARPSPMPIPRPARRARATTRPSGGEDEGDDEDEGAGRGEAEIRGEQEDDRRGARTGDWSEEEIERSLRRARRGGRGGRCCRSARTGRCPTCRRASTIGSSPTQYDEDRRARRELCDEEELGRLRAYLDQQLVHLQSAVTKLANRLQRRLMAQQSRILGVRPGRGAARRRAAGAGDRQPVPPPLLQGRARHRVSRHRRHPADRQFGLDARPADLDRRDQRRHPRPDARALRGQGRDTGLHHPRLEGRPGAREMARRRPAAAAGPAQRPSPHRLQAAPTSPGGGRARASA